MASRPLVASICLCLAIAADGVRTVKDTREVLQETQATGQGPRRVPPGVYPPGASERIVCPFLRMVGPDTTSEAAFLASAQPAGLDLAAVGSIVQAIFQAQFNETPAEARAAGRRDSVDVYTLDQAPPFSHLDLYGSYFQQVRQRITALTQRSGTPYISYLDTVAIKTRLVAPLAGVREISDASRGETRLIFVRSGGNLTSGLVDADDWLRFLRGMVPRATGFNVSRGGLGFVDLQSLGRVAAMETEDIWVVSRRGAAGGSGDHFGGSAR